MRGQRVLELDPLEGGHTYMLDRAGAAYILAIESNQRAYLKCLIAKETLGMPAAHFAYGDFMPYLRNTTDKYDVVFASGVLYHMLNPVELIARAAGITDALFLWTAYYDDKLLSANPARTHRVVAPMAMEYSGFQHRLHRHDYFTSLWQRGFCGGSHRHAYWMPRQDILDALEHFGFSVIETGLEQPDHPNGPAFGVIAKKER